MRNRKTAKKLLSLLCAMALVLGMLPGIALAYDVDNVLDLSPVNLVRDGGFDDENSAVWEISAGKGGYGDSEGYLEPSSKMLQTITVPTGGKYTVGAWVRHNMSATFGVGETKIDLTTGDNGGNSQNWHWIEIADLELEENAEVELFATTGGELTDGGWLNLDGVELRMQEYHYPLPADGNLLVNPGFEAGGELGEEYFYGWTSNNGGYQTNNPHNSEHGFWLGGGSGCYISQTVTVPFSGYYKNSAWITTAADGACYGVRLEDGDTAPTLKEITLPQTGSYNAPFVLEPVELRQGDKITVYCTGAPYWTNGDDFSLTYDFSGVLYNLLTGFEPTENPGIVLPWDGNYIFTAEVAATDNVTIVAGGVSTTVAAGETRTVTLNISDKAMGDELEISVSGQCEMTGASLTWDLSGASNELPVAQNVAVTGLTHDNLALTGAPLSGTYDFTDADEGLAGQEGNSTVRWLISDTAEGEYRAIEGANSKLFTPDDTHADKYIKFEVTPVDGYSKPGVPVRSAAVGPVQINYVRCPGMEPEPVGWGKRNGGELEHGGQNDPARNGFWSVYIPVKQTAGEGYYTLTVPESGYYSLGAWTKTTAAAGTLGVRIKGYQSPVAEVALADTQGAYAFTALSDIPLEEGLAVELYVKGAEGAGKIYADDFRLLRQEGGELPAFTTLHSFKIKGQTELTINSESKTIDVVVPYATDVTALEVTAKVSEGATITPASGTKVDFTNPVEFTIANGEAESVWLVTCIVDQRRIALKSDNETLQDGFNWAARKLDQFVMTGKSGQINDDEFGPGTGPVDFEPTYWCGYYDRSAYYSRDFVHQAVGGQIAGLWNENYNMFHNFAANATEELKWYTPWAFNFDNSIFELDYHGPNNFVREVPAQFELVEKACKQYLWSGDERYITDSDMWQFYTKVMTDFITLHDTNGNGVAEGTGGGIFEGSCTYNELPGESAIEAGDAIGSQYQATLAYAAILKEKGRIEENEEFTAQSAQWYAKAAELKRYFNEEWSVKEGADAANPGDNYVRTLGKNGTKYTGFGHENSWFMPMKLITEPGARNDAYMDYIMAKMGDYIGQYPGIHTNVEAWSYLPDTFFPYNRADDAWKYMEYILSIKDLPHQRPSQGSNGDYPEISFTIISQTIEGMMGMEADAGNHKLVTAPRLPGEVGTVEASYVQVGDRSDGGHILDLTHDGLRKSTLVNDSESALSWEARFYGRHDYVDVDGKRISAEHKDVNGVAVSFVTVDVPAMGTVTAQAGSYSTGGGSTNKPPVVVENPDGSKTTTVTDKKTGAVTETTKWPDGKVVETVTEKNGDKTLAVTGKDGGKVAEIRILAEIPAPEKPFSDVPEGHWSKSAADFVAGMGLFTGAGDGTFSGEAPMTRGMLTTVLHRLSGTLPGGENTFPDVADKAWYAQSVAWAAENGIVTGNGAGFAPEGDITRESLAVMLYRYAALLGLDTGADGIDMDKFSDSADVSGWAADAMSWCVGSGVLQGSGSGLNPKGTASRAEVATMLMRFVAEIAK